MDFGFFLGQPKKPNSLLSAIFIMWLKLTSRGPPYSQPSCATFSGSQCSSAVQALQKQSQQGHCLTAAHPSFSFFFWMIRALKSENSNIQHLMFINLYLNFTLLSDFWTKTLMIRIEFINNNFRMWILYIPYLNYCHEFMNDMITMNLWNILSYLNS